jgi:hypothetical protein
MVECHCAIPTMNFGSVASTGNDHPARFLPVTAEAMLPQRLAKMLWTVSHERWRPLRQPMKRKTGSNLLVYTTEAKLGSRPPRRSLCRIRFAGKIPTTTEPARITTREPSPEIKCMDPRLVQARPLCQCLASRWRQPVVQAYFAGRSQSGITFEQCREEFV